MKAPAVAMAAAFAGGIALGLSVVATLHSSLPKLLAIGLLLSLAFLGAGTILALRARLALACLTSLLCWVSLGFAAAMESSAPRASNHVVSLAESGSISLKTPLRWHGRLRDEPSALPWGTGLEIGISGVEFEGQLLAATGGMRLSYTKHEGDEPLPELHAGDEVAVVTEARLPQTYRDEGAFDRRAYLAREGVDVVAGLRAPALIERVAPATGTASTWIAGARLRLREEVDTLFAATPQVAGVLRAMLLGDRSFVDRDEAVAFQKTGVFHVLVVAGLHVGALATFLFWAGRKLRVRREWAATISLAVLLAYVAVVEQRTPVLRAALMTAIVVLGGFLYRRLDLLNSAGLAALILLVANP